MNGKSGQRGPPVADGQCRLVTDVAQSQVEQLCQRLVAGA